MSLPPVVSRDEWREARRRLLAQEKEATRARDALNAERRRLPMVRIDQEYVFEGPQGKATLADLFGGRPQLIIQHVMFGPDWDAACPGCTASVDELSDGVLTHLASRDTTFVWSPARRWPSSRRTRPAAAGRCPGTRPGPPRPPGSRALRALRGTATSTTTSGSPWTRRTRSTTTGRNRTRPARDPASCPGSAASCATATRSSTPTPRTRGAPTTSAAPTRCWT